MREGKGREGERVGRGEREGEGGWEGKGVRGGRERTMNLLCH